MNIRLSVPFRLTLLALLALTLQACATRGIEQGAPNASDATWKAYQSYASARGSEHDPYRLSGSLRFGTQGDTRRVTLLLWSNGYLPIRLDVMAGVGAIAARIQETQDSFTAYSPNENKAIVHTGPQRVQLNFGKPVPFALRDFSALMRGRFHEVFGMAEGLDPQVRPNGDIAYTNRICCILRDCFLYDFLSQFYPGDRQRLNHFCSFIVSGNLNLALSWLRDGGQESPDEMARLAGSIIMGGVSALGAPSL